MVSCKSAYPLFISAQGSIRHLRPRQGRHGGIECAICDARHRSFANRREVAAYAELTPSLRSSMNHSRGPMTGSQVTQWREGQQAPRSQRRTQVSIEGRGIADIAA